MGLSSGGVLLAGFDKILLPATAGPRREDPFSGGQQLGVVEFLHEGRAGLETVIGNELDGRMYTDLASLSLQDAATPTEKFYIRTRASKLMPDAKSWQVRVEGFGEKPRTLSLEYLKRAAKPLGRHLMECAGNVPLVRFGMISVASWAGVPLAEILDGTGARPQAPRVLITGFDQYATKSVTSVPGASWVFSLEELRSARAFLATEMNQLPLTSDHGAPGRLVVPGWYGCTCIKWVTRIALVNETAEATSQMQEYAGRTHQHGLPALARDFQPATIDPAAMAIRVENWLVEGKIKYRVVGIAWGGSTPVKTLMIRFNPEEDYVPVDRFAQTKNDPWTFWTHAWSPREPGTYSIRLAIKDPAVRTRRLDSGYYVRTVEILEV
ncbi:MAG TPA: molybdopterin-dependent oxidoreductase [Candidatus Acidoferrum sp.]|nr:molybdopterin-dependent oxidoreductase [Candidatus Acidoferrum sp.]